MNEEVLDLTNVCRTCLATENNMYNIYSIDEKYEQPSYVEMLTSCSPLKILDNDGLPHQICSSCVPQLRSAYKYFLECKRIDLILHEYIDKFSSQKKSLENSAYSENSVVIKSEQHLSVIDDEFNNIDAIAEIKIENNKFKDVSENILDTKLYSCNLCDKSFLTSNDLSVHIISHEKLYGTNCRFCNKDLKYHKYLEPHIATKHFTELSFICGYCNRKCLNKSNLINHIIEHTIISNNDDESSLSEDLKFLEGAEQITRYDTTSNKSSKNYEEKTINNSKNNDGGRGYFVCHICNKAFEFNSNLQKHIRAHDPDKPFYCPLRMCRKSFATENSLFLHVNLNHNTKGREECRFCQKVFKHQRNLRSHLLKHMEDKMYKCKYCPKGFNFSHHLKTHERMHTKETPYLCSECGKGFAVKYNLKIHMSLHNNELPYKCPHCEEAFSTRARYRTHKRSHPEECPYMCSHCGKTFPTKTKLTTHIQDVHNADEDGSVGSYKHNCGVCRVTFESANLLTEHMKIHTLQYYCDICKKGFALPKSLEKHKNTHSTAKRTYVCIDCGDCFYRSEHLRSHVLRKHTMVKPHKCEICQKSFVQNNDLTAHKRVHTGEKPYICQVCNRAFAQSNTLTAHIRTHTGERPYICKICNKGHCTAGTLAKHMKTHNKTKENGSIE